MCQVSVQMKQYHDELLAACLQLLLALPDEIVITHMYIVIPALQVTDSLMQHCYTFTVAIHINSHRIH